MRGTAIVFRRISIVKQCAEKRSRNNILQYCFSQYFWHTVLRLKYGRKRSCFTGLQVTVLRSYIAVSHTEIHDRNTVTWKPSYSLVYGRLRPCLFDLGSDWGFCSSPIQSETSFSVFHFFGILMELYYTPCNNAFQWTFFLKIDYMEGYR